ncbi:MAG: hypothetical protein R2764_20395 [Bacteroidales bacterium]
MRQTVKTLATVFLITFGISFLTSCTYDDEIQLDPGQLILYNPSVSTYDITIRSVDENSQEVNHEFWLNGGESISFDLEKGYGYEVSAMENNPNKTHLNVIIETVVIGPHQPTTFYLPED